MKTNLQTCGQLSGLSGKPYDFYKQIDVADFLKYLDHKREAASSLATHTGGRGVFFARFSMQF
jgi:hypothetical protein